MREIERRWHLGLQVPGDFAVVLQLRDERARADRENDPVVYIG